MIPRSCSLVEGRLFGGITAGSSASIRLVVVTVTSVVVVSSRLRVLLRFTCAGTLFRFGLLFSGLIFSRLFLSSCRLTTGDSCRGLNLGRATSGLSNSLVQSIFIIFSGLFK